MNKSAIKNYAVWARNELIARVSQKAYEYGVAEKETPEYDSESVNGKLLSNTEKKQLNELILQVNKHGFNHVMEEVAYIWFNRFIALRFMEVNNYLPQKVNVFTDGNNNFKPQILSEAIHLEIDGVDKKKVFKLIEQNNQEELYKYLLLSVCNDMNNYLPDMFTPITDYKALLIPDHLLNEGSVLDRLIKDIPEEDWTDQVQIIGWLYQYYNSELKDIVMKKKEYAKDDIPAATQLFTPDWIVRYMVENSLGRLWIDGHPSFKYDQWKYYLEEAEQESEVIKQLNIIKQEHAKIKPEEIRVIDPCMGSGHILVYAFDVLMDIYRDNGYSDRDAARSIVENNLYGIEIDERAYQLSYFAIMMKARSYNRRILNEHINHNLVEITESNNINSDLLHYLGDYEETGRKLIELFKDAKEFGSLINVDIPVETLDKLDERLTEVDKMADYGSLLIQAESIELVESLDPVLKEARILAQKYDVVVTNPPYMAPSPKQKPYVQKYYPDSKTDLFAVFIERCHELNEKNGYQSMIVMPSFLFLSSFEKLRNSLINEITINSLLHMGRGIFGVDFGSTSFVINNSKYDSYVGKYFRLHERTFQYIDPDHIGYLYLQSKNNPQVRYNFALYDTNQLPMISFFEGNKLSYYMDQTNFKKIPGSPIAYWISSKLITAFQVGRPLSPVCRPTQGLATGDNGRFLRLWFEVCYLNTSFDCDSCDSSTAHATRWFPYNKGGEFRKWYGNNDYVVNWENDGFEIRNFKDEKGKLRSVIRNPQFYFKECASWSKVSSGPIAFRYKPKGFVFDVAGTSIFSENKRSLVYILGLCNSNVIMTILKAISPTLNYEVGQIANLPVIFDRQETVVSITNDNISLSRQDWDSYETSWDFTVNPLIKQLDSLWDATGVGATIHSYYGKHIKVNSNMELCYHLWKIECNERFKQLKENEEELNRIFIDIYGLQDELTPEERDKDVTVHYVVDSKADIPESFDGSNYVRTKQDEIKSFISYAVGCMFGRYSLDVDGLAYAGGEWYDNKYKSFIPDQDDIIPIYEDEFYGDDDITGRFIDFVRVAFGEDDLEANLTFIADSLGGKGTPRKVIRDYFINDFFKDHCQMYQVTGSGKRPIYWQFDSGKKNGFKALVYIHRYKPDLIARMRTEYVHPQQARYRTQINMLENQIGSVSKSDEIRIKKEIQTIKAKADELAIYEEKIHHWADKMEPMDLDDGVVNNYNKFQELLVPNVVKKPKEK